jgi:hypothetical protein
VSEYDPPARGIRTAYQLSILLPRMGVIQPVRVSRLRNPDGQEGEDPDEEDPEDTAPLRRLMVGREHA